MSFLNDIQDSFKDLSLQGQAKNPAQLLFNPMAVGTVALSAAKDQDNKSGWFSNLFKGGGSFGKQSSGTKHDITIPGLPQNNNTFYIIGAIIVIIILIALFKQ